MTPNEYQQMALRTDSPIFTGDMVDIRIMNGLMGMCGESGECIDILKKHMFQGHGINYRELAFELGDVLWYLSLAAKGIGYTLEDIMQLNIEKLHERYPNGFEIERSIARSVEN